MTGSLGGAIVGGRYRLVERIAVGGMGEVWRGTDELLGRIVAVKILRTDLAHDDAFVRRFREEARTAGSLTHPGIAGVFDYGESAPARAGEDSAPGSSASVSYLVMELVPGDPLSAILAQEPGVGLDPERTLDLLAQASRGLHAAHLRGVIHRDVKPANLLVTPEDRVKITDFGIARPHDHEPLTATGQVMGTAHYLAPELARGHQATAQSDIYALGVVLYECLAGHRPFEGENQVAVATAHLAQEPPPLSEDIPEPVRTLVAISMSKDPKQRYADALVFAEAMEGVHLALEQDDLEAAAVAAAQRDKAPEIEGQEAPGEGVFAHDLPGPLLGVPSTNLPAAAYVDDFEATLHGGHGPITPRSGGAPFTGTTTTGGLSARRVASQDDHVQVPALVIAAGAVLVVVVTVFLAVAASQTSDPTASSPVTSSTTSTEATADDDGDEVQSSAVVTTIGPTRSTAYTTASASTDGTGSATTDDETSASATTSTTKTRTATDDPTGTATATDTATTDPSGSPSATDTTDEPTATQTETAEGAG